MEQISLLCLLFSIGCGGNPSSDSRPDPRKSSQVEARVADDQGKRSSGPKKDVVRKSYAAKPSQQGHSTIE